MLYILAILPLAESSAPPPRPPLTATLADDARMVEPEAVAQALTNVIRINVQGGWLADLRGFDGPERQELSDLLRGEGVGLGDRSKLRRLATVSADHKPDDDAIVIPRRAQQADGREVSATNAQLKTQQGDHAGTAQPSSKQADGGLGLSGDSASASLFVEPRNWQLSRSFRREVWCMQPAAPPLKFIARRSNRAVVHGGPRNCGLRSTAPTAMQ
jgi:hypothetical protein